LVTYWHGKLQLTETPSWSLSIHRITQLELRNENQTLPYPLTRPSATLSQRARVMPFPFSLGEKVPRSGG
jgi:hypothetical protein